MVAHLLQVSGTELIASHLPQEGATEGGLHCEAVSDAHLSPHHNTTSTLLFNEGIMIRVCLSLSQIEHTLLLCTPNLDSLYEKR